MDFQQSLVAGVLRLYVVERMTFRVLTPEAAVALAHEDDKSKKR